MQAIEQNRAAARTTFHYGLQWTKVFLALGASVLHQGSSLSLMVSRNKADDVSRCPSTPPPSPSGLCLALLTGLAVYFGFRAQFTASSAYLSQQYPSLRSSATPTPDLLTHAATTATSPPTVPLSTSDEATPATASSTSTATQLT